MLAVLSQTRPGPPPGAAAFEAALAAGPLRVDAVAAGAADAGMAAGAVAAGAGAGREGAAAAGVGAGIAAG